MVKLEQALILDPPAELHFKGPFTDVKTSYLRLTNPTDRQICFKLKTTAPKTYCVRPNCGVVEPHETSVVAVMLQPIDTEAAKKSKHKFMVQSLFAPDGEINAENLWRDTPAEDLMNSKLKCVFDIEPDVDSGDVADTVNQVESASEVSAEGNQSSSLKSPDLDLQKAREENKQLLEQLRELRTANASYKEEHMRFRVTKAATSHTGQSSSGSLRPEETPLKLQIISIFSSKFKLIAVAVFILGVIIGAMQL